MPIMSDCITLISLLFYRYLAATSKQWGCLLEPDYGISCQTGNLTKWFYNSASGQCESFTFGGCGGNRNNFPTIDLCLMVCSTGAPQLPISLSSPSVTPGTASRCPQVDCTGKQCSASGFMTDESGCTVCQCIDPCEVSIFGRRPI
jgi:Kunitz/Bovine pancreatic trypsin inhibitor domain/Antistasin family